MLFAHDSGRFKRKLIKFVRTGHHRVCIPPAQWIEDCHTNAVPCYGTLLTEHGVRHCLSMLVVPHTRAVSFKLTWYMYVLLIDQGGALENAALLDNAVDVAEKLAAMLEYYGFDGWLVNIEAPLPGGLGDVTRLCGFLGKLREACRARCAMCVSWHRARTRLQLAPCTPVD